MEFHKKTKRLEGQGCNKKLLGIVLYTLVFCVFLVSADSTSLAGLNVYEKYYGTVSPNYDSWGTTYQNYQSFTIGVVGTNETLTVKGLQIGVNGAGGNYAFNFSIYNATNTTTCLFSELVAYVVTPNIVLNGDTFVNHTLAQNGTLYQGSTYCLRLNGTVGSALRVDRGGTYAGGFQHSQDYGGIWKDNIDILFGIYGVTYVPPTTFVAVNITHPLNISYTLTNFLPILNYTITGSPSACWYSNNSGIENFTIPCGTNITNINYTGGANHWYIFSNDTANVLNFSEVYFFITNFAIDIKYPTSTTYTANVTELNYTIIDPNPVTCKYTTDFGVTNVSITCGDNVTGLTNQEGQNTWTIYANNTLGQSYLDQVNFTLHTQGPLITYGLNNENDGVNVSRNWIFVNVSIIEQNESNITFNLYDMNKFLVNSTFLRAFNYSFNFTQLPNNLYYYNVTSCDAINICNTTLTYRITLDTQSPAITRNFPSSSHSTTSHTIVFNWNVTDQAKNDSQLINGLVAYYALEDNTDSLGKYNLNDSGLGQYAPGRVGNALNNSFIFGNNTYNELNLSSDKNFSVCFWTLFYGNSAGTSESVFGFLSSPTQSADKGPLGGGHFAGGSQWQFQLNTSAVVLTNSNSDTTWYYHCLIKNATTFAYYINNTMVDSNFTIPQFNASSITSLILGGYNIDGSIRFRNLIDEFGVWNRTLTLTEMDKLYNHGFGLTYPFANSSGTFNTTIHVWNQTAQVNETVTATGTWIGNLFKFLVSIPITLADGVYHWFVEAVDFANNYAFTGNSTLTIDSSAPMITMTNPTNTTYLDFLANSDNSTLRINWTVNDATIGLQNCWYEVDNGTRNIVNCFSNFTAVNISYGGHNITLYANDSLGNTNHSTVFATWIYVLKTNAITFEDMAAELSTETFVYNATVSPFISGISLTLNYNNTDYPSTLSTDGINSLFTNILTTPSVNVTTNITFFWNITATDSVNTFSSLSGLYNQTVNPIHVGLCGGGLTQIIYNFTAYDEDTLFRIQPFYFGGTFSYSGNSSSKKTVTVSQVANETDICIDPAYSKIYLDLYVTYDEDKNISQFYQTRNYVLQNHIKYNNTEEVNLTLLNISRSTSFILKVQDADLVPLPGYVVNTYRKNPSTGTYYLTQSGLTDSNGVTSGFFETNTVDYHFTITKDDVVVLETSPDQKVIPQTLPYTLVFTINPVSSSPLSSVTNISDFNFTIANTTTGSSYTYSDSSGNFTSARLEVYLINNSGPNRLVCNVSSVISSGVLSCNFNGINGTYSSIAHLAREGKETLVSSTVLEFPSGGRGWGLYGVLLGMFIILVSAFAFRYNEIAGIWLVTAAIIFVGLMGFIDFGITFTTAVIVIAIILTVVMRQ